MMPSVIYDIIKTALDNKRDERQRAIEYYNEHQQKAALWERRVDVLNDDIAGLEDFLSGAVLAGDAIKINPIQEVLKAGQVIGLNPREMLLNALDDLERERHGERS